MAGAPKWKVYSADNEYRASFKYPEDAAALIALLGGGSTIRAGHLKRRTVWTEGADGIAADSYDEVAETCYENEGRL